MCDFIAWALNDFDINPDLYNSMDKQEVKLVTDKIIKSNSNDNDDNDYKSTLLISQNILVQMKTKRVRFADKNSYCIF